MNKWVFFSLTFACVISLLVSIALTRESIPKMHCRSPLTPLYECNVITLYHDNCNDITFNANEVNNFYNYYEKDIKYLK